MLGRVFEYVFILESTQIQYRERMKCDGTYMEFMVLNTDSKFYTFCDCRLSMPIKLLFAKKWQKDSCNKSVLSILF